MAGRPPTTPLPQAPVADGGLPDGWIRAELAALSACGPVRDQNEDRVAWTVLGDPAAVRSPGSDEPAWAELAGPGIAIAIADGLGGHSHGELASRTAIGRLLRRLTAPDAPAKPGDVLRAGFEDANQACLAGELVDADAFDRDPVGAEPRPARERRRVPDADGAASEGDRARHPRRPDHAHGHHPDGTVGQRGPRRRQPPVPPPRRDDGAADQRPHAGAGAGPDAA